MFHSPLILPSRYISLSEEGFYSRARPTPLDNPRLVHLNQQLADEFRLNREDFSQTGFLDYLGGKGLPESLDPVATAYSGHQFGVFNPGLGDGRAILLGEFSDRRGQRHEFQLKGSGPTPYSRGFDGRSVLRSVIREYLGSEAIHGLGIPTTRALCLVDSNTPVVREQLETGSMMIRVAPSHIRFGSFELFYGQGRYTQLRQLANFCIDTCFEQLNDDKDRYGCWFDEIVRRSARLVAHWQSAGFCHGVINTDNFSILGLTFDYGPFGFMEQFDPEHVCNHSDHEGRYAFSQQPRIGLWNCLCLAQALTPLIDRKRLEQGLELYEPELQRHYLSLARAKLGLEQHRESDSALVTRLLELLQTQKLDYSRFFRGLCELSDGDGAPLPRWLTERGDQPAIEAWVIDYRCRLQQETRSSQQRRKAMRSANPKYVLRNYLAQTAIECAREGDYSEVNRLLKLVQRPFDEHPGCEQYAEPAAEGAADLPVSCSS